MLVIEMKTVNTYSSKDVTELINKSKSNSNPYV